MTARAVRMSAMFGITLVYGCFVVDGASQRAMLGGHADAGVPFDPIADWYPDAGCTGLACASIPVELAAGDAHTCARMRDGSVRCWGSDARHQLGSSSLERPVPALAGVRHIAAGAAHSCALVRSGEVLCWGANEQNQTGTLELSAAALVAPEERRDVELPQRLIALGPAHVSAVAAAAALTCVILEGDQQASDCIGSAFAEIGRQRADEAAGPTRHGARVGVANLGILTTAISARRVVLVDRAGRAADANVGPNVVHEAEGVIAAAAGWNDGLLLMQDGTVRTFGTFAPCGPNEARDGLVLPGPAAPCTQATDPPAPARVLAGVTDVAQVAMSTTPYDGVYAGFACLRSRDGTVSCWGDDARGQLGRGVMAQDGAALAPVAALTGVTQIALGFAHACALTDEGRVYCWGDDRAGQLGSQPDAETPDASARWSSVPVEVRFP